jgi:hypothetical protein
MTLAEAKAKTNETFIVQASLTIVTYDRKNMFIVLGTFTFSRAARNPRISSMSDCFDVSDDVSKIPIVSAVFTSAATLCAFRAFWKHFLCAVKMQSRLSFEIC